jgi:hypothetical protein
MMPESICLPFLRAARESVASTPWNRLDRTNETWVDLDTELEGWDPSEPLHLRRRLDIDVDRVRRSCRLAETDSLRIAVIAWSRAAGVRRCVFTSGPLEDDASALEAEAILDGDELADRVEITTQLVTSGSTASTDPIAPRGPGCVVWEDVFECRLEGQGSQFPLDAGDFEQMPWLRAPDAPWHIDIDPDCDLDDLFLRCVRLQLNSAHPAMQDHQPTPGIDDFLSFDIARSLLLMIRDRDDFEDGRAFPGGSVGKVVMNLLSTTFPGTSVMEIRSEMEDNPNTFETRLRSNLRLLHD